MTTEDGRTGRERWAAAYARAEAAGQVRDADFTTLSGVEVDPVYGPADESTDERMERIGWPGEFPFTRGLHPSGYRGRPWTIRQFAGFGNARQTNERYRMILAAGGGGLSVAFDMPTLMGRDSDDPRSLGEVGHCGVAIDSAADMEMLFAGIDLGAVTTSMTISGPAVPMFCMYVVAAERQGVDPATLNGTLQTDIFKEYIAQKEWLFAPEPHLRLIGDLMEYCTRPIPAYKPLSVSGYHIREAGSTAAQELAFTLADGFGYVELGLSRGLDIDRVRARAQLLLRRPHRLLRGDREVPGRAADLGPLAARPVRGDDRQGAVAALPHPDRRGLADRPAALQQRGPDRRRGAGRRARRDQLAAHERAGRDAGPADRGVGRDRAADPAGAGRGDRRGQRRRPARRLLVRRGADRPDGGRGGGDLRHDHRGLGGRISRSHPIGPITSGLLLGIEEGWFTGQIADAAFRYQTQLEKGDKRIVGVNVHTADGHRGAGDPAGQPRGRARAARGPGRAPRGPRPGRRVELRLADLVAAGADRGEPDRADARRRSGRGDAGRDLRRAARRVGRVRRTGPLLTAARPFLGLTQLSGRP